MTELLVPVATLLLFAALVAGVLGRQAWRLTKLVHEDQRPDEQDGGNGVEGGHGATTSIVTGTLAVSPGLSRS